MRLLATMVLVLAIGYNRVDAESTILDHYLFDQFYWH